MLMSRFMKNAMQPVWRGPSVFDGTPQQPSAIDDATARQ